MINTSQLANQNELEIEFKNVKARDVLRLLLIKHSKDVCVPECKTGSSWGSSNIEYLDHCRRSGKHEIYSKAYRTNSFSQIDLWVMKRSWSNFNIICYEIKVRRSDFLSDRKWPDYLEYCNEFYFATPKDLLKPQEIKNLPPQAGLIEASKNMKAMRIKKKAVSMQTEINPMILYYVLMWRADIRKSKKIF